MRNSVLTSAMLLSALVAACGPEDPTPGNNPPPVNIDVPDYGAAAQSPFFPSAIGAVMDSMAAAVAARPLETKPAMGVLLANTTEQYWQTIQTGATRMRTRLACRANIASPGNAATIQTYIADGSYRGLAVAASADASAAINTFVDQRGPAVTIDSDAPDSKRSYFIAMANYQAGVAAANKLREALNPGDAIAVFGSTAATWVTGYQRAQGAEEGAAAAGLVVTPRIGVAWNNTTDRTAITTAISDANLNIKGLICLYANSARCAEAVEAAGKKDQIKIIGFDMQDDTKAYFDKGYFYAVAVQRQYFMGQMGVLVPYTISVLGAEQTAALLQPIVIGGNSIDTGMDIVTPANYADYIKFLADLGIGT